MTSFIAVERSLFDHPFAFCLIMSTIDANIYFFLFPKCSKSPRYFSTPLSFWIWREYFTSTFNRGVVGLEKEIDDFAVLIAWPETSSYQRRRHLRTLYAFFNIYEQYRVIRKYKWFTRGHSHQLVNLQNFSVNWS